MASTQIVQRQIANGAIADAQVQAGAGIQTSKLADGLLFIKSDGSVAMAANWSMGNFQINNLANPSVSTDAANKAYVDTQIANIPSFFSSKPPAVAAATTNITVSNPGTAVFDGVTLSTGQILFLVNQSNPAQNGLYNFNGSSSALTRISEMNTWALVVGALIVVEGGGSTYGNTIWLCTVPPGGTLETTAITFLELPLTAGLGYSNFITRETPAGTINGSNVIFTLANTPHLGTEEVYLNGLLQDAGAGNDYTISGNTITMLTAPLSGDKIRVSYLI